MPTNTIKAFTLFLLLHLSLHTNAQDSLKTLSIDQFLNIVRTFHPIVKQSAFNVLIAKNEVTTARSNFDPIASGYASGKTFDGINYYDHSLADLKLPTWFGIEVYTGFENLSGNRNSPEQTLGRVNYTGISIPLAKDLLMDKRRAILQQAKVLSQMSYQEQRLLINDLIKNAMDAYWNWVKAFQTYTVLNQNVAINEKRFDLIKRAFVNGERAAIDTVEALVQLQEMQLRQNVSLLQFQNTSLELSNYLWQNNDTPYTLPRDIVPQDGWENSTLFNSNNINLNSLLSLAEDTHPELQLYKSKLLVLDIEKQYKFQSLLPKINLMYNHLGKGYGYNFSEAGQQFLTNNFQYGIKFEVPLRLSQGRGDYKIAKLKINNNRLEQSQKQLQIEVKIKSYYNDFMTLQNQVVLQNNHYDNCIKLLRAEESRLLNGESTLFVINARENKAFDSFEKLIDLKTKYFKTFYYLQWSAGALK
jgi:outer membrane protein TolC